MSKEQQTSVEDPQSIVNSDIEKSVAETEKNSPEINNQSSLATNNTSQVDVGIEGNRSDVSSELSIADTDIAIKIYKPTVDDVVQYAEARRNNKEIASSSFNDYLKQKYFSSYFSLGKYNNTIVVADLSGIKLGSKGTTSYLDLRGIDLTGSIIKNVEFTNCDLTGAIFCDTDLGNAYFKNTKLRNVDLRGADLADCQFDTESYIEKKSYVGITGEDQKSFIEGIKYSMTSHLGRYYADIKADAVRAREKREAIEAKTAEVKELRSTLSYVQAAWVRAGGSSGNKQYDAAALELSEMKAGKFPAKEYIMNQTFQNIFGSSSQEFDPTYVRGSDKTQKDQRKQHVSLSRKDLEEYLELTKIDNKLSLNDFAKSKFSGKPTDLLTEQDRKEHRDILKDRAKYTQLKKEQEQYLELLKVGNNSGQSDAVENKFSKSPADSLSKQEIEEYLQFAKDREEFLRLASDKGKYFALITAEASIDLSQKDIVDNQNIQQSINLLIGKYKDKEDYLTLLQSNAEISLNDFAKSKFGKQLPDESDIQPIDLLTKKDIAEYLELAKSRADSSLSDLAISDFAKGKTIEREMSYLASRYKDREVYLTADTELSLDEFARGKFVERPTDHIRFIADFSGQVDPISQKWVRPDLRGLEFKGTDLKGVNFSGADLSGCKFTDVDISGSTFESAIVANTVFTNTVARDVNFFNADLQATQISGSDFQRAFMPKSNAEKAQVSATSFDYSDIRNGKWNGVNIGSSTFNYANLEGISLINASMKKVQMQHAILSNAMMNEAKIIESDLRNSQMTRVAAIKTKWQATKLESISARSINLEEAEFDELCKLADAQLQEAIMTKIKAERVSFLKANMDGIKAEQANLQGAILNDASIRFAKLEETILKEAQARGVDMTGANITNAKAMSANFSQAIMKDINAQGIDLSSADMSDVDLSGSDLFTASMNQVNLRRANLNNTNLKNTDCLGANVEGARVNDATRTAGANFNMATGNFIDQDGKLKSPKTHKQEQEVVEEMKSPSLLKKIGNTLYNVSNRANKTAEFIKRPISSKIGKSVGLVVGLTLGIAIAAAIPTGGLSLAAVAVIGVGVVAGCAAIGTITGNMAARRCGLTVALTCATITGYLGPVAGLFGAAFAAKYDIDGKAGRFFENISNKAKTAAAKFGINKQLEEMLKKHLAAEQAYVKSTRPEPEVNASLQEEQQYYGHRIRNEAAKARSQGATINGTAKSVATKINDMVQQVTEVLKDTVTLAKTKYTGQKTKSSPQKTKSSPKRSS